MTEPDPIAAVAAQLEQLRGQIGSLRARHSEDYGHVMVLMLEVRKLGMTEDGSSRFGIHDLLGLFTRATCQETDDQATPDAAETPLVRYHRDLARFLEACGDARQRPAVAEALERRGQVHLPWMISIVRCGGSFRRAEPRELRSAGRSRGLAAGIRHLDLGFLPGYGIVRFLPAPVLLGEVR